jgi:predicted transglutaminase-like cysteine proteinase
MSARKKILVFLTATFYSAVASAGMFGSIEKKNQDMSIFPKWTNMLARLKIDEAYCEPSYNCNIAEWKKFIESQKGNPDKILVLQAVNRFINDVEYINDASSWNQSDYWETPYQFFSKGGDCEDFATAKFITLLKIGFNNDDMRVVVINNLRVNEIHAVLVVNVNGKSYVLDNQIPVLEDADNIKYYRPIYSINETNWWKHS